MTLANSPIDEFTRLRERAESYTSIVFYLRSQPAHPVVLFESEFSNYHEENRGFLSAHISIMKSL